MIETGFPSIERTPEVPELTEVERGFLGDFIFLKRQCPEGWKPESIFVFGGTYVDAKLVNTIHIEHPDIPIIATGGKVGTINQGMPDNRKQPLSSRFVATLKDFNVPETSIIEQSTSTNTKEDVTHTQGMMRFLQQYEGENTALNQVLAVCKAYHAMRCYLTFRKQAPGSEIYFSTYDWDLNGNDLSSSSWTQSLQGMSFVWGEFKRIVQYSKIGEIADPESEIPGLNIEQYHTLVEKI